MTSMYMFIYTICTSENIESDTPRKYSKRAKLLLTVNNLEIVVRQELSKIDLSNH